MAVEISKPRSAPALPSALVIATLLVACAHQQAPTKSTTPPPPAAQIVVESVPTKRIGPAHTPEMKDRADRAAASAAVLMQATERECGAQWFGDGACDVTFFRPFAVDYQAYYALERDPARTDGRVDSLPRVGGPDVSVEDATTNLSLACEERCRASRLATIHTATEEAGRSCSRAPRGYAACEALGKKVAHTLPEREADLAEGSCEGQCDNARAQAAHMARVNARRPRTKAQEAACEAECGRLHGGGWCGTPLLECMMECSLNPTVP